MKEEMGKKQKILNFNSENVNTFVGFIKRLKKWKSILRCCVTDRKKSKLMENCRDHYQDNREHKD